MLVLARKLQQKIIIGDDIVIQVVHKSRDVVKLGIEAPPSVPVHRQEVYNEIQRSNSAPLRRKGDPSSPLRREPANPVNLRPRPRAAKTNGPHVIHEAPETMTRHS